MTDIARNIKRLRQARKLTQEELGEKLYVTRQAVSNWETGKNQPDLETLKTLASVLEVDVKDLLYPPVQEGRRGRILAAAALWALTAVAWLAYAWLYGIAAYQRSYRFDLRLMWVLTLLVRPLGYLLLGGAVCALAAVWRDLRPRNTKVRWAMLAFGGGLLLLWLWMTLGAIGLAPIPKALWRWYGQGGIQNAWVLLFSGGLLFCTWAPKVENTGK